VQETNWQISQLCLPKAETNLHIFSVIITSRDGAGVKTDGRTPNYVYIIIIIVIIIIIIITIIIVKDNVPHMV